jgi:dTDP-4-dehydrorhamnose reductase
MRAVVIGTSGQLATELRRQVASTRLELAPAERVDLAQAAQVSALLDRLAPQLVINAAAYTAVDRAESEPQQAAAVNTDGPARLARWCAANGAALLHVSTDYVFDGQKSGPYTEEDATEPMSVYGRTKLGGEVAVRGALERHVILRTSWVFSAHGQNFVKTMLRLARERDELRVVADQHGRPTSAADLARVLLVLAERYAAGDALPWGTYHFAGRGSTTWHGFAQAIVKEQAAFTAREPRVTPITTADYPTPARRPANSVLDTSRFESSFGLSPRPWLDDLREVVQQLAAPP